MDVHEVLVDQLADLRIFRDEIGEAQAPRAPVAAHLADDELAFGLSLFQGLVDLDVLVDGFVIHFLESLLCAGQEGEKHRQ